MPDQPSPRRGGLSPLLWALIAVAFVALFLFFVRQPAVAPGSEAPSLRTAEAANSTGTTAQAEPTLAIQNGAGAAPAAETAAPAVPGTLTPKPASTHSAAPTRGSPETVNGLPTIELDELPPEALDTLALIEAGGPFPFPNDGGTFQNREGLLPPRRRGYYTEYTVITPGEDDRGARRIVAGEPGEYYYTDDHYTSFSYIWIEP